MPGPHEGKRRTILAGRWVGRVRPRDAEYPLERERASRKVPPGFHRARRRARVRRPVVGRRESKRVRGIATRDSGGQPGHQDVQGGVWGSDGGQRTPAPPRRSSGGPSGALNKHLVPAPSGGPNGDPVGAIHGPPRGSCRGGRKVKENIRETSAPT